MDKVNPTFPVSPSVNYNAGVYITLVCCCFLFNAGGAVYLLAQAKLERRNKIQFAVAALISIALKLVLASRWSDYDLGSYGNVASLVLHGKSVYANTEYYNYAPLWSFFLAGLKQISTLLPTMRGQAFHFSIAAFLAVVDVALAALLAAKYRYGAGIFFLCCPVTVLLTGSYSQFDNFALLAGLAAWLLVREGAAAWRRVLPSAGLLGLSLVIKHVFFLFPLWLLFWPKLGSLRKRMAYLAIAYGLFVVSFLPGGRPAIARGDLPARLPLSLQVLLFRVSPCRSLASLLDGLPHGDETPHLNLDGRADGSRH